MQPPDPAAEAAAVYLARKARTTNPSGQFDNAKRWSPAPEEWQPCCRLIRTPSRAYPYSYMVHCRTVEHVANLYGVPLADLRRAVRALEPAPAAKREGGDAYYKAVACKDGEFLSIFDGMTAYEVGRTVAQRARRDHRGGIYVYKNLDDALLADVPDHSALSQWPRAVLRVRAEGAYVRYYSKLAFSKVTPLEVAVSKQNFPSAQAEAKRRRRDQDDWS